MTGALLSMTAALLAYEATTHSGLTQRAALTSRVDATLRSWGLHEGLFTVVRLPVERLARRDAFRLRQHLDRVDPVWGGAADERGRQRALGWLVAGSVLEEAPASRGRHHFLDPRDGSGLEQSRPGLEWLLSVIAAADGEGTLAGAMTGTNSPMLGKPADRWVMSTENEWGIPAFWGYLRGAIVDPDATTRGERMARALLAVGSVLHVLQDMASPTHVRNDLLRGHLAASEGSVFDRSSRYERLAAMSLGQAVPEFEVAPARATLQDYFRNLASETQRGFVSPGTLPGPVPLIKGMSAEEALARAATTIRFPMPSVTGLDFNRQSGYLRGSGARHLLTYRIDRQGNLRFGLDERCFSDQSRVLLPRAGAASVALLEHLIRPGPALHVEGGGSALLVDTSHLHARSGEIVVVWEDREGRRRQLAKRPAGAATLTLAVPSGAVKVGALIDGKDAEGERVVAARVVDL